MLAIRKKKSEPRRKKDDAVYQVYVKNENEGTKTNQKKRGESSNGLLYDTRKERQERHFFLTSQQRSKDARENKKQRSFNRKQEKTNSK